jgi:glucuronoarabinoxylan endo-1,4-beta-xylanase
MKSKSQMVFAGALYAAFVTGCIGREAGNRLTSLAADDVYVQEVPTPANDADYPDIVDTKAPAGNAAVAVSVDSRFQTLEGFGAATAWYDESLVGRTTKGVYELLFPDLGLDIIRFRNRFNRSDYKDNHPEWSAEILERANKALGRPLKVMLSGWSPPAALKASQMEKCKGNDDCTLAKENGQFVYQQFADYWLESVKHYASLGVVADYVSIQNEPDFIPPDWEGCKFTPAETTKYPGYDKALAAVHAKLQQLKPPPKMLGPEVLGVHYDKVQTYLRAMDQNLVYGVAHHLYEKGNDGVWDWRYPGPDSYLDEMQGAAKAAHKPLFQTEFMTDDDKGIDGGFETAWLIHHTLVGEGAVAFIYWNLVWPGNDGLVGMRGKYPQPRDQYYSMRHYARFTDPGYVRVEAHCDEKNVLASAYLSPDDKRLTVVLLNTAKNTMNVQLDTASYAATKVTAFRTVYRPGHSKRWGLLASASATAPIEMPARSVVTIAFER